MKAVDYLIVKTDQAYNNEKDLGNGVKIVVNSTIESIEHINRKATVVSAPDYTILKEGDEVIIHHNIFRKRNGLGGALTESNYFIKDNTYFVPLTEVFLYKRDNKWSSLEPYCFIEPIKENDKATKSGIYLGSENSFEGNKKNRGKVVYGNSQLEEQGVREGDEVVFSSFSEYKFNIDGQLLYKMSTKDILMKV